MTNDELSERNTRAVQARYDPEVRRAIALESIEKAIQKANELPHLTVRFTRRDVLRVADAMGVDIRKKRTNTESDKLSNPKK